MKNLLIFSIALFLFSCDKSDTTGNEAVVIDSETGVEEVSLKSNQAILKVYDDSHSLVTEDHIKLDSRKKSSSSLQYYYTTPKLSASTNQQRLTIAIHHNGTEFEFQGSTYGPYNAGFIDILSNSLNGGVTLSASKPVQATIHRYKEHYNRAVSLISDEDAGKEYRTPILRDTDTKVVDVVIAAFDKNINFTIDGTPYTLNAGQSAIYSGISPRSAIMGTNDEKFFAVAMYTNKNYSKAVALQPLDL
jgi:hypothetical protein